MLSKTVEYALRAMVYLADHAPEACPTEQIAQVTRVESETYLSKVLQRLARAGLIRSQRGVHGGFFLEKSPTEVTVLDVVNAVDPIPRIHTCPLNLAAHGARLCPLHRRMDDALAMVEESFGNSTLAEILAEPTQSPALCDFPSALPERAE